MRVLRAQAALAGVTVARMVLQAPVALAAVLRVLEGLGAASAGLVPAPWVPAVPRVLAAP